MSGVKLEFTALAYAASAQMDLQVALTELGVQPVIDPAYAQHIRDELIAARALIDQIEEKLHERSPLADVAREAQAA
jgi:hypothetical protein